MFFSVAPSLDDATVSYLELLICRALVRPKGKRLLCETPSAGVSGRLLHRVQSIQNRCHLLASDIHVYVLAHGEFAYQKVLGLAIQLEIGFSQFVRAVTKSHVAHHFTNSLHIATAEFCAN
jgi:hypothetical protein